MQWVCVWGVWVGGVWAALVQLRLGLLHTSEVPHVCVLSSLGPVAHCKTHDAGDVRADRAAHGAVRADLNLAIGSTVKHVGTLSPVPLKRPGDAADDAALAKQTTFGRRDGMPAHCAACAQSTAGGPRMAPPEKTARWASAEARAASSRVAFIGCCWRGMQEEAQDPKICSRRVGRVLSEGRCSDSEWVAQRLGLSIRSRPVCLRVRLYLPGSTRGNFKHCPGVCTID